MIPAISIGAATPSLNDETAFKKLEADFGDDKRLGVYSYQARYSQEQHDIIIAK